ncbi:MAG: 2-succinyl-5-enolpyruvyl-6-hydroxy-3-cyclohexene-1-carboxylic-acid synthase [Opitutales bacterium]|nr:2-succinyl-5-enolpyruvyl-6-hydroxy-3-cyclohexene-1-carboxylic-acid synthase [Opitutales bacterium]
MSVDTEDIDANAYAGRVFADAIQACGVRHVVVSPGSRSTPLTMAVARQPDLCKHVVLDERSAAFCALGIAKREGIPVVLICTSGSAVANYYPAIIEAHHGQVPLLVVTADRPPELRDCGAGQTIDQVHIYGRSVRHFHELGVPEPRKAYGCYLRDAIQQALRASVGPSPGPVHLNFPFREPFPSHSGCYEGDALDGLVEQVCRPCGAIFSAGVDSSPEVGDRREFPASVGSGDVPPKALLVFGSGDSLACDMASRRIGRIASRKGWVVLADALSPLRNLVDVPVVRFYDAVLRNPEHVGALKPDLVVQFGSLPTSKPLRKALTEWGVPVVLVTDGLVNYNALRLPVSGVLSYREAADWLDSFDTIRQDSLQAYSGRWMGLDRSCESRYISYFDALTEATCKGESAWAWHLCESIVEDCQLMVSNSNPVRDFEFFWRGNPHVRRVFCNRGANGIDGVLSTAWGTALGSTIPSVLVTGDLAFLHDSNAWLTASHHAGGGRLCVVLVDNHGGGIFEHLAVADGSQTFEQYFATPHKVDIGSLCVAYGVQFWDCGDWKEACAQVSRFLEGNGPDLQCMRMACDRKSGALLRTRLQDETARVCRF